ncbi:MAG: choice-of-anchor R domain-containing protein [Planctomycetia bacterium]
MANHRFSPVAPVVLAAFLAISQTGVHAAVLSVFGNLGTNGTGNLSATSTTLGTGTNEKLLAQGFQTSGTSSFSLNSIFLGLASTGGGTSSATVSLFANVGTAPSGSALWTSSPVSVTTANRYFFTGPAFTLSSGSSYWVIPSAGVDWYTDASFSTPTAQNSSGFGYVGTVQSTDGINWTTFGLQSEAISVQAVAVPEPTTYAMAAAAAGLLGFAKWRRRQA